MTVTASAPGKVILFGEHAVVYGEPAIAAAIDKRIFVSVEVRRDDDISVSSTAELQDGYPYVRRAVELGFEYAGERRGLDIDISSEFPPASGLGSSAAVSVATIQAVVAMSGAQITKRDVARLGHRVEKEIQGAASITDSSVTSLGGVQFIKPEFEIVEEVEIRGLPLVVGYTGKGGSTKELVRQVRERRDANPEIMDSIIHEIGRLTVKAKGVLEETGEIGELMNINQGLLESMGIGTSELSRYVYAARDAGAAGAKITGAGGGGCMIAFVPENQEAVAQAIEGEGGLALSVSVETQGVRLEG